MDIDPLLIRASKHVERALEHVEYAMSFVHDVPLTKYNIVRGDLKNALDLIPTIGVE